MSNSPLPVPKQDAAAKSAAPASAASAAVKAPAPAKAVKAPTPAKAKPAAGAAAAKASPAAAKPATAKPAAAKVVAKAKPAPATTAAVKTPAAAKAAKAPAPAKAKPVKAVAAVPAPAKAKPGKDSKEKKSVPKKPKLVRDSFTFPEADYARIGALKQRALKAGREVKKSELLRAGLVALSGLSDSVLLQALDGIDKLKPGRPAK